MAQRTPASKKGISSYRVGIGLGHSFILTKGMDFLLTTNTSEVNELRPSAHLSVLKILKPGISEIGFSFRHGESETFLKKPNFGCRWIYDEIQLNYQYSLNGNAGLNRGRLSYQLAGGIGIHNFKSKYFLIDLNDSIVERVFSSVGYPRTDWDMFQRQRQNTLVFQLGFGVGLRVNKYCSIYWDSNLNLLTTTKIKGDLSANRGGWADGYWYNSIGLFIRIKPPPNKLKCPRLR